jgi:DNA-directed RNA polymerase specialized sigma24 family protein
MPYSGERDGILQKEYRAEIATARGVAAQTVKARLHRARLLVREYLTM